MVWTLCLLLTFFPLRGSDVVRLGLVMSAALCPWLYAGTWKFLGRVTVRSHIISSAQTQVTVIIGASKENLIFPAFLCPSAPTLTVTVQVCRSLELLLMMTQPSAAPQKLRAVPKHGILRWLFCRRVWCIHLVNSFSASSLYPLHVGGSFSLYCTCSQAQREGVGTEITDASNQRFT